MMKTIELKKEKVYCGNLLLVNAEYPLKNNNAESLIPADIRFPDILMKRDAAYVLQLVLEKICAGNSIVPVSGYRSLDEQFDIPGCLIFTGISMVYYFWWVNHWEGNRISE